MPVRIIFRGLTLFQFPETGPNAGKLVVYLINKPELTGGVENASKPHPGHGKHEHNHSGEIQILSGEGQGHDSKPVPLERNVNVDIVVPGTGDQPVSWSPSFERFVPNLGAVIANGSDAIRNAGRGAPNLNLIQNVVTVDRGVAHVKHVIDWDQERYPLSGNSAERGQRPGSPVLVKFMGSSTWGHMASEVIVEIENADEVDLRSKQEPKLNGQRKGTDQPNHRVPVRTVEVLVTNYEFRRDGPVAWGLDYQWLFETVGFRAAELAGQEFDDWSTFARRYDDESYESERALLLGGPNRTEGRPFPYIESEGSLTPLQPLTDQHNPPVCASGFVTIIYTETETLPDGTVKTKQLRVELGREPKPPAPPTTTT